LKYFVQLFMLTTTLLNAAEVDAKKSDSLSTGERDEVEEMIREEWFKRSTSLRQLMDAAIEKAFEDNGACMIENSGTFWDPDVQDCRHCSTCWDSSCYNKCYTYELERRFEEQAGQQQKWSYINTMLLGFNLLAMAVLAAWGYYEKKKFVRRENARIHQSPVGDSDDFLIPNLNSRHPQQA